MNRFFPKNVCPECEKVTFNYNITTLKCKCEKCGKLIEKELHTLNGAILGKNPETGCYTLMFPDHKEYGEYPTWEDLQIELKEIENTR